MAGRCTSVSSSAVAERHVDGSHGVHQHPSRTLASSMTCSLPTSLRWKAGQSAHDAARHVMQSHYMPSSRHTRSHRRTPSILSDCNACTARCRTPRMLAALRQALHPSSANRAHIAGDAACTGDKQMTRREAASEADGDKQAGSRTESKARGGT